MKTKPLLACLVLAAGAVVGCNIIAGLNDLQHPCASVPESQPCPGAGGATSTSMSASSASSSATGGGGAGGSGGAGGGSPTCGLPGLKCCQGMCQTHATCDMGQCVASDVWAANGINFWHWGTDLTWSDNVGFANTAGAFAIYFGDLQGWAVGIDGYVYRWSGNWAMLGAPFGANALYAIAGTGDNDVWIVGKSGLVQHYDGSNWKAVTNPATFDLHGVWATAPHDVWVVGGVIDTSASILHWNGTKWRVDTPPAQSPAYNLAGVWASGAHDVWAIGSDANQGASARGGILLHGDGTHWTYVPTPEPNLSRKLSAIWGFAADDIWVSGQDYDQVNDFTVGALLHYDGSNWSKVDVPMLQPLTSIWGAGPADVWTVGGASTYHWDGSSWTRIPTSANANFQAVRGR